MVEVTLVQRPEDTKESKACWYPFQKQRENRKTVTQRHDDESWKVDRISNAKLSKVGNLRLCNSSSIDKKTDRQERLHHKNGKKKSGSVSTSTETDTSFVSEETRTTARTGASSLGTYNKAHASSSRSHFSHDQNSTADFSYQSNSIADKSFIDSSPNRMHNSNHSPSRFNPRLRPQSSNFRTSKAGNNCNAAYAVNDGCTDDKSIIAEDSKGSPIINRQPGELNYQNEKGVGDLLPAVVLSKVETNCMAKEFWTDEAVDGGAFACIDAREKKLVLARDRRKERDVDVTREKSLNRAEEVGDNSVKTGQKVEQRIHPLGRIIRFVSQDPEDTNDEAPLRRMLCSSAPCRNPKTPMLCRHRGSDSDIIRIPRKQGGDTKEKFMNGLDEEEPNFYVEVEAMRDQLNGIRDLDEIEAQSAESEKDNINARASSLVDEDSAFMNSLEGRRKQSPLSKSRDSSGHDYVDSTTGAGAGAMDRRQREKQKKKRSNFFFQTNKKNTPSRVQKLNSKGQRQDSQRNCMIQQSLQPGRQHENIGRQNELLSEMVTDRVLAMRVENEIISNSMERKRDQFNSAQNTSNLQRKSLNTSHRAYNRETDIIDHGQLPPRIITPRIPASSFNPLNLSELTELSHDQLASNLKTFNASTKNKNNAVHRNSSGNATQAWNNNEKKVDLKESEIGYYRGQNTTSHKTVNSGIDEGKFDDNFWKEDNDDLNSAAFEKFGSENDSVFDDLRSQSSTQENDPKKPKDQSKYFETNFQRNFG